jgi:gamma-glutamyl:cysteine ligase YbdK (ATP-grasp superfamily)
VAAVVGDEDYPISEKSTTVVTEVKPEPLEPEDEEGVDFDL